MHHVIRISSTASPASAESHTWTKNAEHRYADGTEMSPGPCCSRAGRWRFIDGPVRTDSPKRNIKLYSGFNFLLGPRINTPTEKRTVFVDIFTCQLFFSRHFFLFYIRLSPMADDQSSLSWQPSDCFILFLFLKISIYLFEDGWN